MGLLCNLILKNVDIKGCIVPFMIGSGNFLIWITVWLSMVTGNFGWKPHNYPILLHCQWEMLTERTAVKMNCAVYACELMQFNVFIYWQ